MVIPYGWSIGRLARDAGVRWKYVYAYLDGRMVSPFVDRRIKQALARARR